MSEDVQQTIDRLKAVLRVTSDAELARKLRVDRSTIASWKARGKVPDRFASVEEVGKRTSVSHAPDRWDMRDVLCFHLAIFRFTRAFSDQIMSDDFRTVHDFLTSQPGFWQVMSAAETDLMDMQEERGYEFGTAFAMLIHEDLQDMEKVRKRVIDLVGPSLHPGRET